MIYGETKPKYRGQFSGHETFPLRLLWLKKAYDAVGEVAPLEIFHEQKAISMFGVGRNMAASIRYWATASGFFEEENKCIHPTKLGKMLLDDSGVDPFLEWAGTIWLVHWAIASTAEMTTTAYYAFNGLSAIEFDPTVLVDELLGVISRYEWRGTRGTVKRDVEVFLRSYVRREGGAIEDAAEPLLVELGLIREARLGGWYEFVRGPKPTLPDSVFLFALEEFWERQGGASVMTAEQICYSAGSPGRVFKLDEDSVITRLMGLENLTTGAWRWTDTAGLRQVQKVNDFNTYELIRLGRDDSNTSSAAT